MRAENIGKLFNEEKRTDCQLRREEGKEHASLQHSEANVRGGSLLSNSNAVMLTTQRVQRAQHTIHGFRMNKRTQQRIERNLKRNGSLTKIGSEAAATVGVFNRFDNLDDSDFSDMTNDAQGLAERAAYKANSMRKARAQRAKAKKAAQAASQANAAASQAQGVSASSPASATQDISSSASQQTLATSRAASGGVAFQQVPSGALTQGPSTGVALNPFSGAAGSARRGSAARRSTGGGTRRSQSRVARRAQKMRARITSQARMSHTAAVRQARIGVLKQKRASAAAARALNSTSAAIKGLVGTAGAAGTLLAPIAPVAIAIALVGLLIAGSTAMGVTLYSLNGASGGSGAALVAWAEKELADGPHVGGDKYLAHNGAAAGTAWCSFFVKTGWDECGFSESIGDPGYAGMANRWIIWPNEEGVDVGSVLEVGDAYKATPGDIIVVGDPIPGIEHSEHVGIVVTAADEEGRFDVIEGNSSNAVQRNTYFVSGGYWRYAFRPKYPAGSGYSTLMEGVDFSMSESEFVKEWAPRINEYFKNKSGHPNSPLIGYGEAFAKAAYEGHVDPRLLPAISLAESGCGEAVPSSAPYNCYGWGVTDSGNTSAAYADGYEAMIHKILVEGILGTKPLKDYSSVDEIAQLWPGSPEPWATTVKAEMAKI